MNDYVFKIDLIPDNAEISISKDETILTASLRNDIQHLHACGGLGMCSTCRVEILEGEDNLSQKSKSEQKLSEKLELPSNIRLACQTKIKGNVKLKRLLLDQKDLILANQMTKNSVGSIGSTKNLALMFVDIVSFTPLSEQLPSYDVMYILNRYFDDMGTIIKKNGGDINNFIGDAFLAAFGIDDKIDSVYRCTQAALEILEDVDKKKKVFLDNYNINFDVRVGVHYGEAIVGMLGNAGNQRLSIIGQSVNIASRVETANKEAETRLLISEDDAIFAAKEFSGLEGMDLAKVVSTKSDYIWNKGTWPQNNSSKESHNIVAYDFGIKENILRLLNEHLGEVKVILSLIHI